MLARDALDPGRGAVASKTADAPVSGGQVKELALPVCGLDRTFTSRPSHPTSR